MISVVIPAHNAESGLVRTLGSLLEATMRGLVRDVVVVDAGSSDMTVNIAEDAGCEVLRIGGSRGRMLDAGARHARGPWLLFLHAGVALEPGWDAEVWQFIRAGGDRRAATFRFAVDGKGLAARGRELAARLRNRVLAMPYGNQGLLISKAHYERVGGFRDLTALEDVDFAARLRRVAGRAALARLGTRAIGSMTGSGPRGLKQLSLVTLYGLGLGPRR